MRYLLIILCFALVLSGCAAKPEETPASAATETAPKAAVPPTTVPETQPPDPIGELLDTLSSEEKVGQLFLARCNAETALKDIANYHLGGFVLFAADFESQTPDSMRQTLSGYQRSANIPLLLAVDEEGGTVTRISRYTAFRDERFPSPRSAYKSGGMTGALENEQDKCDLLKSLGLNVNIGPVCDLTDDPDGFMYSRSLGQTPETTGEFVAWTVGIMDQNGIGSVLKHFPGYGNNADTHVGIAVDSRSLEELEERDLVPFAYGIHAGCGAILVSHTIVECLDSERPASLSPAVHTYLREDMGYTGVILTDDLVMEAITDLYGAGEAAVMAVQAGNDLLCSTDYATQYDAVLAAVADGIISQQTLDAAAYRVLKWKMELGLL